MSDAPAEHAIIELRDVRKRFTRVRRVRTLAELVFGLPRRLAEKRDADGLRPQEFFALRDLNLTVVKGECLGVIGANGSGKSTLLKLLFRILRPDTGSVTVRGRVGGLIELGAGFHPYLTGRENVFINGAILGMKQSEIRRKYDSIVEFAGMAEFMDMPVKDYSSGMFARLAFAIAAAAEPEVLLVDEVLAVGDTAFQIKCYDWMAQRRKQGTTVVLVSHNLYQLADFADRVAWLETGRLREVDKPWPTCQSYLKAVGLSGASAKTTEVVLDADGQTARIETLEVLDESGASLSQAVCGSKVKFRFRVKCDGALDSPALALSLRHQDPRYVLNTPEYLFHLHSPPGGIGRLEGASVVDVLVENLQLPVGRYVAKVYLFRDHARHLAYERDGLPALEVIRPDWSDARALTDHRQLWTVLNPGDARA